MSTEISTLRSEVACLKQQLLASQKESKHRYQIIDCLCYVTNLERCEICFDCMTNREISCIMQTTCGHCVCVSCWNLYKNSSKRGVHMRCPWNSCIQRDTKGGVIVDNGGHSIVKSCSIESQYNKNHLLQGIDSVFQRLKLDFEHTNVRDVFDRKKIPTLISHYVKTGQVED